ncbi:MAG: hypothetical protein KC592_09555 [Nitrospira sp.]|nr:hypothetical protein [Nitrospira sp.]
MMRRNLLAGISMISLFLPSIASATEAAGPPMVELSSTLNFTAPDGSELSVTAGIYSVEQPTGMNLRLVAELALVTREILATTFTHEETLTAPLAFVVREKEQGDTVHLLFLLPDGKGFDAVGQADGVHTRGGNVHFRQKSQYTGVVMQQSRIQLDTDRQRRATMQGDITKREKELKELQQKAEEASDSDSLSVYLGALFGDDPGAGTTKPKMKLQRCDICKVLQKR